MRFALSTLLVLCALTPLAALAQAPSEADVSHKPNVFFGKKEAPDEIDPKGRTVKGVVVDSADQPVDGAVVTLKNLKTGRARSFITKSNGTFYFDGLSTKMDFELVAMRGGKTTQSRKLSVYDRTLAPVRDLHFEVPMGAADAVKPAPTAANKQ